jgi:hypothetical protein
MEYDLPENSTNTFPVVFFFHGLGDTAKDAALSTGWREISSEKSLIVIFMQGNVRKFGFGKTSRDFFFLHGKTILMFVMNYFFGNHSGVLEKGHAKIFYGTHKKKFWEGFWVIESISLLFLKKNLKKLISAVRVNILMSPEDLLGILLSEIFIGPWTTLKKMFNFWKML